MKRYITSILMAVLVLSLVWVAIPAAQAGSLPAPARAYTWTLAWSDEFNDASIDTSKWQVSNFMSPRNNEKNYYTTEDAYLSGGSLVIRAQQRSYGGAAYTSGQLISKNYVVPGSPVKIEMRLKAMNGRGLHSAVWAFHDDTNPPAWNNAVWPPEIDVLEVIGSEPQSIYQTYHAVNTANDGWNPIYNSGIDFTTGYHTVTAEWVPGSITFYYDGILNYTVANSGIDEIDMKILLDTSIGGNWPGMPDASTVFPNYTYVDYVRVYTGGSTETVTPGPSPTATATPVPGNLVLNPGFESDWANWDDSIGGTTTIITSDKHSGGKSAQLAPWSWRAENVILQPNTSYTISGWGNRTVGTALCTFVIKSDVTFTNGSVSFTSSSWAYQTSTFTTPASWGWAMTQIYADNSTCLFDDLSLMMNSSATPTNTPVPPTPTRTNTPVATPTRTNTPIPSGNLVLNPGFETGSASPWGTQSASVGTTNRHGGSYAIKSIGADSGYWQLVTGLSPNTTYTFSGWLKSASTSQKGMLYAKNFGGTDVYSAVFNSTTYTKVTITFTTGATNTSAEVGFWRQAGTGNMFGDDFSLTRN